MKLINGSVNRPVGVIIVVLIVMMLGFVSLSGLAVDLMPDMELPVAVVMSSFPGAAPQDVENLVTRLLEGSLSGIQGVNTIQSISAPNQSVIILMFEFGTNLDSAMLDIRDRLDLVRRGLPSGAAEPMVMKFDPNAMPVMQLGVSVDMDLMRLTQIAEETVMPRLERLPGVGQVALTGGEKSEIRVMPDMERIREYGINLTQIVQLIGANNRSAPAGQILSEADAQMPLRIIGDFTSIQDVMNVNIPTPAGQVVKVRDIASVEEVAVDRTSYAFINGEPTLSLDIMKQADANTVDVSNAVMREIERIESAVGQDVKLSVVMDSALFIRESISSVAFNMVIGGVMAILVLLLFLRSVRSTLIIGLSIPIALISAFTMIYFSGQTINILTLGGLALGIGLLVDSSIVILENIFKYRERGYSSMEAAKMGASEVGAPVIASTLTSMVVFVPIVFTGGFAAELFMPLALTVGFILLASLIVALTVVPMLSRLMLPEVEAEAARRPRGGLHRIGAAIGRALSAVTSGYRRILRWAIHHGKTVAFSTLALLVASLAFIPMIGFELVPEFDQGEVIVQYDLPPGTSMTEARLSLESLEKFLAETKAADMVFTTIGGGGSMMMGMGGSQDSGSIYVRLVPESERTISTNKLMEQLTAFADTLPDIEVKASAFQSMNMGGSPIEVQLRGQELDTLKQIADELQTRIAGVPGAVDVTHSMGETRPEMQLRIDLDAAISYGLLYPEVMQTVMNTMNGQTATFLRTAGRELEVRVLLPEEYRTHVAQLENLPLMTPMGNSVPLSQIAEFVQGEGPSVITRQNQMRGVSITGDLSGRELAAVIRDVEQVLEQYSFPDGYSYQIGGEYEMMRDTFVNLALALLLAVFLVYAVMAFQFEKFMYPFIVMFSVPVTVIGIIFGFLVTGRSLSAPAFIGLIMLAGIVVNNAIVLVDFINKLRREGMTREDAILEAGAQRLRPILMTMLTTVLAMAPLAIGFGAGSEMQAPMATVIVFGLSFSTLITLLFIPVMYMYMDRLTEWWKGLFTRRKQKQAV